MNTTQYFLEYLFERINTANEMKIDVNSQEVTKFSVLN